MFENNLIAGVSGQGGGYSINDSLRFNDNDSAYLSRTPSVAGNRKTWTWSGWVKLGNITFIRTLFSARFGISNSDSLQIYVTSNDQLNLSGVSYGVTATPLLRDPSGWYHIVIAYDTTQATDTNRVKFYINGIQASATGTYPSLNLDAAINNTQAHNLGRRPTDNDRYFDGYMAEVNLIDGQALTADSFGQIDATTGEWSPKKYSGTYGTNGFYLQFKDGAALGDDTSGNTNDWTPTNLASTDQMLDTPTNNFATLNPLDNSTGYNLTLAEGNLKCISPGSSQSYSQYATMHIPTTGKWYFEYNITQKDISFPGFFRLQLMDENNTEVLDLGYVYSGAGVVNYNGFYEFYTNGENAFTQNQGDIIGISVNRDTGMAYLYRNGVLVISGNISSTTTEIAILFVGRDGGTPNIDVLNFGQDSSFAGLKTRQGNTDSNGIGDFYYEPPVGFLALCENNLPTSGVVASGGTETTILDGGRYYKVHTFTSSDTFTVTSGGDVEYLVVAGGGGTTGSGGGGAGGYRSSVVGEPSGGGASAESKLAVTPQSYTITVGAGGAAGTSNGSNSSFGGITSIGGGYGGSPTPSSGGSGGGGGISSVSRGGAAGTSNQGYRGGNNIASGGGGGGGGAGQIGGNGLSNTGGNGGNGIESSIDGTPTYRAGGGAGGSTNMGTVGLGGGSGANTGGGGGDVGPVFTAEAGGSGIVIIRYAV